MHIESKVLAKGVVSFLFASAVSLAFSYYLNSPFPIPLLLLLIALKSAIYTLRYSFTATGTAGIPTNGSNGNDKKAGRWIFTILSGLITIIYAASILFGILITPYSSYAIWITNLPFRTPQGVVSSLMTLICALFASLISGTFFSIGWLWPLFSTTFVIAFLLAFFFQTPIFMLILILALVACFAFLVFKYYHAQRLHGFAYLLVIAVLSSGLSLVISGQALPTGSLVVDQQVHPYLRKQVLSYFPDYPLPYPVPGYGFSFNEARRLGETPFLTPTEVFEIQANKVQRLYLQTRIFDYYDGQTWKYSSLTSGFDTTDVFFQSSNPAAGDEIRVKILTDYYNLLPFTQYAKGFRFHDAPPSISKGGWNTGFTLKQPFQSGDEYFVIQSREDTQVPERRYDEEASLQLPRDLPDSVRDLAEKLRRGAADTETVLKRIQQYLALNYTYTLDPMELEEDEDEFLDEGEDFVSQFLFGAIRGYCVHFATSFTLLARLNGIPSRYLTGFMVNIEDPSVPTVVTGLHSHAWPEVWIDGQGWTIWEATPASDEGTVDFFLDLFSEGIDLEDDLILQRSENQADGNVSSAVSDGGSNRRGLVFMIITAVFGAAALTTFGIIGFRRFSPRLLSRNDQTSFGFSLKRMVTQLKRRGVAEPSSTGWMQWGKLIQTYYPVTPKYVDRTVSIINQTVFGARKVRDKDKKYIRLFRRELKKQISEI